MSAPLKKRHITALVVLLIALGVGSSLLMRWTDVSQQARMTVSLCLAPFTIGGHLWLRRRKRQAIKVGGGCVE